MKKLISFKALLFISLIILLNSPQFLYSQATIQSIQIPCYQDSYVQGGQMDGKFGASTTCVVGYNSGPGEFKSLLKFQLTSIPTNAVITKAIFNLYYSTQGNTNTNKVLKRITSTWDESTVTYRTIPTVADDYNVDFLNSLNALPGIELDITRLVKAWNNGVCTNYGFMLQTSPAATNTYINTYFTKEGGVAGQKPKLTVYYYIPTSSRSVSIDGNTSSNSGAIDYTNPVLAMGYIVGPNINYRTLINFNYPTLSWDAILNKAVIRLTGSTTGNSYGNLKVGLIKNTWNTTVTYAQTDPSTFIYTTPSPIGLNSSTSLTSLPDAYIDISSLAMYWKSSPTVYKNGFMIYTTDNTGYMVDNSNDYITAKYRPVLDLDYTTGMITSYPPSSINLCQGSNTSLSVSTNTNLYVSSYRWQYSTDGGTNWISLSNLGGYSNVTTATMTISGVIASMNNYKYRCNLTCRYTGTNNEIYTPATTLSVIVNPSLYSSVPASGAGVCPDDNVAHAEILSGSGGTTGAYDTYQYSINNGSSWTSYISGATINTTGAVNKVLIRVSRTSGSIGCTPTTIVTWPVSQKVVDPIVAEFPLNGSEICAGYPIKADIIPGSGGPSGTNDAYTYMVDAASPLIYTSGKNINTIGTRDIGIVVYRNINSQGCTSRPAKFLHWSISPTPILPSLNIASPAEGTKICEGFNGPIAAINGGLGGITGTINKYQYSIDNGVNWTDYISNTNINTTGAVSNVQVKVSRPSIGYGCDLGSKIIATWPIATPVDPTLNISNTFPVNGTGICASYNSAYATFNSGSVGEPSATDVFKYSINNGSTWTTYTPGTAINTTGASFHVLISANRSAGSYNCPATTQKTLVDWPIASPPTAPLLNIASPVNGSSINAGFNTGTVLAYNGTGGSTGTDQFRISIDNGSSYNQYYNGNQIITNGAAGQVLIESSRTGGAYCPITTPWIRICTWNVLPLKSANAYLSSNNQDTETSISDQTTEGISIYPNPANDIITITNASNSTVEIVSTLGQVIKTFTITDNETKVDISDLASGIYVVNIKNGDQVIIKVLTVL